MLQRFGNLLIDPRTVDAIVFAEPLAGVQRTSRIYTRWVGTIECDEASARALMQHLAASTPPPEAPGSPSAPPAEVHAARQAASSSGTAAQPAQD